MFLINLSFIQIPQCESFINKLYDFIKVSLSPIDLREAQIYW